ncbi:SdpI family protein [Methanoregula sp.]|uniref:SdpI family protein n=1 Tax=Methanoregula sp. TaxID=2052170 RepID=UPI0035663555
MTSAIPNRIRAYLGWCPMTGAAQHPAPDQPAGAKTGDLADSGGSVTGRADRFMHLTIAVVVLSYVVAILILPFLPEVIPVHWNLQGKADGFAASIPGAFGLPVIITLVTLLFILLPKFDSRYAGFALAKDIYAIILFATTGMLLVMEVIFLLIAAGYDLPVITIIPVLIGFLFIILGSLMPYIHRNTTMGIRLPWTMKSDDIWKKTHEHGGPLFMAGGILTVIGSLVSGIWAMALMLVIIIGVTIYISVWSYRYAKTAG